MGDNIKKETLLIDDEHRPLVTYSEGEKLATLMADFIKENKANADRPIEDWLPKVLEANMPELSKNEIDDICEEIVSSIEISSEKQTSLSVAITDGRSKESWFADEVIRATKDMSSGTTTQYMQGLDDTVSAANESLRDTITTKLGEVSQNPQLDGYIAEDYHAQTFNMNAEASGSQYRARVVKPDGHGYEKDGVDIEIYDKKTGEVLKRYQSKYGSDAKKTESYFDKGDYENQERLVPDGQEDSVKDGHNCIEAPDGTKSKPLSKEDAKKKQEDAQSGNWNDLDWNEYQLKDLAKGICIKASEAAILASAISVGIDIATKLYNDEKITLVEEAKVAVKTGADAGLKAAIAGALKVAIEKGSIHILPKGTPASICTMIAVTAVEDVKIMTKIASGEYTFREGIDRIEQTTVSTVAGMMMSAKGALIGTNLGIVLGPVGAFIGGLIGGLVGYMIAAEVGKDVTIVAQKMRNAGIEATKEILNEKVDQGKYSTLICAAIAAIE